MKDITKVFLYAYPQLAGLIDAAETETFHGAVLSFADPCGAVRAAEKIAARAKLACSLKCLKSDLDAAVEGTTEEERFLLSYKYFRGGKRDAFRLLPFSERTYFRKQRALLERFAAELSSAGWSRERFLREFGRYAPFVRLLRAILEGKERKVAKLRKRRGIAFSREGNGEAYPR